MKLAILGTGGIGSTFAFHLARAGHDVTVIARGKRLEQLRATGGELLAKPFRIEDLCSCLRRLPGVRFDDAPTVTADAPPLDFETIVLPEDLCTRMTVAAELHSTTVLKACLEELRQLNGPAAALADHLRQRLRAYDLEGVARLLARLPVQPALTQSESPAA